MSVELDVRLSGPLNAEDLLQRSRAQLGAMVNCPDLPMLIGQGLQKGRATPLIPDQMLVPGKMLLISTDQPAPCTVSVVATEIPGHDNQAGLWMTVKVETRVPAAFALAIAVAVAAAGGGEILDESRFWYPARTVAAAEVAKALTLQSESTDFLQAAESFYAALPKGRP
ncbi:MAG TPA: hypothetical protein VNT75_24300 [Symbiobacteriaceae bacterium]|nr:hypothetical protein [Symbiobacteriaceae bacterium]